MYIMTSSMMIMACQCAVQCLTCAFDDLCEDVIGQHLFILNGTDPPLDALTANLADGPNRLTIRLSFEWVNILCMEEI